MNTTIDLSAPGGIEALLAFHRSVFGDARMEDEGDSNDDAPQEGADDADTEAGDEQEQEQEQEGGEEESEESESESELPERTRTELRRLRAENANWRTKLRETQDALGKAKTPEEFEAATSELNSKIAELERRIVVDSVAKQFGLPDELAAVLQGDDEAALKAHAKTLAKFVTAPGAGEPGGGLNPNDGDDGVTDPGELARRHAPRRR